jgi:hypothetical protein
VYLQPHRENPFCGKPGCTPPVGAEVGTGPSINAWFGAFELQCPCGACRMINLLVGQVVPCKGCPRIFRIADFRWNAERSNIDIIFDVGIRKEDPASKIVIG